MSDNNVYIEQLYQAGIHSLAEQIKDRLKTYRHNQRQLAEMLMGLLPQVRIALELDQVDTAEVLNDLARDLLLARKLQIDTGKEDK